MLDNGFRVFLLFYGALPYASVCAMFDRHSSVITDSDWDQFLWFWRWNSHGNFFLFSPPKLSLASLKCVSDAFTRLHFDWDEDRICSKKTALKWFFHVSRVLLVRWRWKLSASLPISIIQRRSRASRENFFTFSLDDSLNCHLTISYPKAFEQCPKANGMPRHER